MTDHRAQVRARTAEVDAREARRVAESDAHRQVDNRSPESTYDLLPDALMAVIGDQVFAALNGPEFRAALRERGYVMVPLTGDVVPDPPDAWMHACLELMGGEGDLHNPFEQVIRLWASAWRAGRQARDRDRDRG